MKDTFASRAFTPRAKDIKNITSEQVNLAISEFLSKGNKITYLKSGGFNMHEDSKDFAKHYLGRCQGKKLDGDEETFNLD